MAGSFNDSVAVSGFGNRCGFALDPEREVVVVSESHEQAEEAARKLAAVGFTQLAEVGFGIDSAHAHARFEPVGLGVMAALADRGELQVVDVREASEQSELATGAIAVPYRLLAEADLSALDPEKPTAVVCHTGTRTPLAASLLARRGFTHVRPVLDEGMGNWGARDQEAAEAELAKSSARASAKARAQAAKVETGPVRSPETAAEPVEPLSG